MNNMLTLEEVKNYLEADQAEVEKHLREGKLHAYKIGGTYLRFRKEEVLTLRSDVIPRKHKTPSPRSGAAARVADFWRFNNFYIISLLLVIALAVIVTRL